MMEIPAPAQVRSAQSRAILAARVIILLRRYLQVGTYAGSSAGSHDVTISYSLSGTGASNYSLALEVVSGTITAKPLTVSGSSASKVYDGDTTATSGEVSVGTVSGKVGSENVTVSGTGTFAGDTVGTHNVSLVYSLSGADAANYSLASEVVSGTITAKPLSISGTSVTKVYDGDTSAGTGSIGSESGYIGSEGDNITAAISSVGTYAGSSVGSHDVTISYSLSGTGASNYSLASEVVSGTITAKPLSISGTSVTKVYDGDTTATSGVFRWVQSVVRWDLRM